MKVSRLSPRYENELIEHADDAETLAKADIDVETLREGLRKLAKSLRFMVTDNERFLNS